MGSYSLWESLVEGAALDKSFLREVYIAHNHDQSVGYPAYTTVIQ